MSTETLPYYNNEERLEAPDPLTQFEEVINTAIDGLSPEDRARLEAPNPVRTELQFMGPEETDSDTVFKELMARTPEVEAPNHNHGRKGIFSTDRPNSWVHKRLP